jgi:hypothetical protein
MKRNKMKKIVALLSVLFATLVPIQSHAADQKALVIIDSYFDSRVIGGNVTCLTPSNGACNDETKTYPASLESDTNHGDAMVEVAKKQSAGLKIIALKSAAYTTPVNPGYFLNALKWVDDNSSKVSAVSFSRILGGTNGVCSPSATNSTATTDTEIRAMIKNLSDKGIKVFASTSNKSQSKYVSYPACILETNSVSSASLNKAGVIVPSPLLNFDANTDYFANYVVSNYKSTVFGSIPQTTSSATAAVAAQYVIGSTLAKVVTVNP